MVLRSLQWRLVFIFVSITLSLMFLVSLILNKSVEASYYDLFKQDLASSFKKVGLDTDRSLSYEEIKAKLEDQNFYPIKGDNRSYTVWDKDTNEIIISTDKMYAENEDEFENMVFKSENLVAAFAGGTGDILKLTRAGDRVFFDYACLKGRYVLYFKLDSEEWRGTINTFNINIFYSGVFSIIISLILGFILSRYITEPLKNIMRKAERIAEGDFDHHLTALSQDEIGKLTDTFNYMAVELKNKLEEISSEKNKIETILNYMTDGVIAFNLNGEVIHANPAFYKMLQLEAIDFDFIEFSRRYSLGVSLEEVLYLQDCNVKEKNINVNDKAIRVYFAIFTGKEKKAEGLIAVFQDITEQQRLENMRREFVANVSHELRTPLTSIKSYSETLIDGALEDKDTAVRFLNVINSEADRMTRLVKDLLQLSRMENEQVQWSMEEVSIVSLVKGCIEKHQIDAINKKQTLECYVIGDIPLIQADRDRMVQVIINLLSNAIKYTPEEGKITTYVGKTQNYVYIKVSDTGIGIPEEDLPRVCERFYRVDKARSRELGGTGLGLAIVKEIVEAHDGIIDISSVYGKGTDITVKLPICNSVLNAL